MSLVSNTGPLIALAKIDRISLLEHMFSRVLIPPAVQRELLAKTGPESARLDEALFSFVRVTETPPLVAEVKIATSRLDVGEQEAIALAYEQKAPIVIDDRLGRAAARRLGLSVTGVAGVLVRAKETGLVPAVRPLLDEMRQRGYWLSDEILNVATALAGEG